jgi:hypothetical protein
MKNLKWFSMIAVFAFVMVFSTSTSAATSIANSNATETVEQSEIFELFKRPRIRKRKRHARKRAVQQRRRTCVRIR